MSDLQRAKRPGGVGVKLSLCHTVDGAVRKPGNGGAAEQVARPFELHEVGGASDLDEQFVIHTQAVPSVHPLPVIIELAEQDQGGRLDFRKIFPPSEVHAVGGSHHTFTVRAPLRAQGIYRHKFPPHGLAHGWILQLAIAAYMVLPPPVKKELACDNAKTSKPARASSAMKL
jgi:hypothetical protein